MFTPISSQAIQGVGLGLRAPHYQTILGNTPPVPWFEALLDNYLGIGGSALNFLEQVRHHYPLTFHGVGMSLGSCDPLDYVYLKQVKALMRQIEPAWVSEHLSWTGVNAQYSHDLLPMPYTTEAVQHLAARIAAVQEYLGQQILIENVSSYASFTVDAYTEWDFLSAVADRADCLLLLDVNNIFVSAVNHGFDPLVYLRSIPAQRVREIHLAGYSDQGTHLLDTHGEAVHEPVWALYRAALEHLGPVPTLIEWDNDIPDFAVLQAEATQAECYLNQVEHRHALIPV